MLARLRARQPGRSLGRILGWYFWWSWCWAGLHLFYRYRAWGARNLPRAGPLLLVSNHQSFLDPAIVGVAGHRRQFYAMARSTLWQKRWLGRLIDFLNAIPVDRGTADMAAMRRCIEVLKQGHALLIFPEGTRTPDGTTKDFAPGTMLLIKRAQPLVVPVAIEGAHAAWPKDRKRPYWTGRISVMYGEPIPAEKLVALGPEAGLAHLRDTVESMRQELARRRGGVV